VNAIGRTPLYPACAWLLAALLSLQGTAAAVAATLGPAHVHRSCAGVRLVLDDLRRAVPTMARHEHVATLVGHVHADTASHRHHHAAGDSSVVPLAGDAWNLLAQSDDATSGAALSALVAVLPEALDWHLPAMTHAAVTVAAPSWRSHEPEPDERPPRTA
jgi:hypothetical protein